MSVNNKRSFLLTFAIFAASTWAIIALLFFSIGIAELLSGLKSMEDVYAWRQTRAKVIELQIRSHEDGSGFTPRVKYTYDIRGVTYISKTLSLDNNLNMSKKHEAEEVLAAYSVNQVTDAYYNPRTPSEAVLIKKFVKETNTPGFLVGIILFLFFAGFGPIVFLLVKNQKNQHRPKASAQSPSQHSPPSGESEPEVTDDLRHYLAQGDRQKAILIKIRNHIDTQLNRCLQPEELTYQRFDSAVRSLTRAVQKNFEQQEQILTTIRTICPNHINDRLAELQKQGQKTEADHKETETLEERLSVRMQMVDKISELLTENEEALTKLTKLQLALDNMSIDMANEQIDEALAEVGDIIDRTQAFRKQASDLS